MVAVTENLIGVGLYSASEAAALTGVPVASIRRWLQGYKYRRNGILRECAPVWAGDVLKINGQLSLSFLDMMEARFIRYFRIHHISWQAIHEAACLACDMFKDSHPFTRGRFRTDGKRIFHQVEDSGKVKLFDMNRHSWVFNEIIESYLYADVELFDDQVYRWFPIFPDREIIIDPNIAFGRPILREEGIPTDVIAAAFSANDSDVSAISRWYKIKPKSIKAAVSFEARRLRSCQ